MGRGLFSGEFKLEAVRLVREREVTVAQGRRDRDVGENVLRQGGREFASDPGRPFPGQGQVKLEQQKIERLGSDVAKLKVERAILKVVAAYFAREST
jgi:transposase